MSLAFVVPFVLGAAAVIQAGINRRIAAVWGLGLATLLNSLIVTAITLGLVWLAYQGRGPFAGWVAEGASLRSMRVWWLIPGLAGLGIIVGLPWAMGRIGALTAFVALVAAQMLASLLWDQLAEGIAVTPLRALGAALALIGAALAAYR